VSSYNFKRILSVYTFLTFKVDKQNQQQSKQMPGRDCMGV